MSFSFSITDRINNTGELFKINLRCLGVVITTGVGVVGTTASLATLCKFPKLNVASKWTLDARFILPELYRGTMGVLNPSFTIRSELDYISNPKQNAPYFVELVSKKLTDFAINAGKKETFIEKQLVSRIGYAVSIPVALICRIADLVLGILGVVTSVLTLGMNAKVNQFAYTQLKVLGAINDICVRAQFVVNPQAKFY